MLEYLPWSKKTLDNCISIHKNKMIPSLDFEFSSACTAANCIYCDSKPMVGPKTKGEMTTENVMELLEKCRDKGLRWIYTCGLGEPTEDNKFWDVLSFAKENGITISFFTNGLFINKEKAKRLMDSGACIILKLDTFEEDSFDRILGGSGRAKKIYCALDNLLNAGYGSNGDYTNLAFSIVPISLSIDGIPDVIEFAMKNGIFPSVGELEKSGAVFINNVYNELYIENEKLIRIKAILDYYFDGNYRRPICPSVLTGLHFNNMGKCIVDRETGLNCAWFMLNEPKISVIGDFHYNVDELLEIINCRRKEYFSKKTGNTIDGDFIFGGCGGNTKRIFELASKCLF